MVRSKAVAQRWLRWIGWLGWMRWLRGLHGERFWTGLTEFFHREATKSAKEGVSNR